MLDLAKVENDFKKNEGFWFTYPDDEDIQIKIRPLFPDKINEFTKKAIKIRRGIKELDNDKQEKLTRNYTIEDWKGIKIGDNEECNNEAKDLIAKYCTDIMLFILEKAKETANIIVSQDEEQIKNLKSLLG